MGLLQPDSGLVFWVSLAFLIVFLLLAKFGFPIIIRSLEERKQFIDSSLKEAASAERRASNLEAELQTKRLEAEQARAALLREAHKTRDELIAQARLEAEAEGARLRNRLLEEAEQERDAILKDAQRQVALMAVSLTEKLLGEELAEPKSRRAVVDRLLNEAEQKTNPTA